jgi:hypothetical protein
MEDDFREQYKKELEKIENEYMEDYYNDNPYRLTTTERIGAITFYFIIFCFSAYCLQSIFNMDINTTFGAIFVLVFWAIFIFSSLCFYEFKSKKTEKDVTTRDFLCNYHKMYKIQALYIEYYKEKLKNLNKENYY